jgi:hypothetical protein
LTFWISAPEDDFLLLLLLILEVHRRRPTSMMRGNMKMRKMLRIKANSDMSQPLLAWSKSNLAVAYIWMRRGA